MPKGKIFCNEILVATERKLWMHLKDFNDAKIFHFTSLTCAMTYGYPEWYHLILFTNYKKVSLLRNAGGKADAFIFDISLELAIKISWVFYFELK